MAQTPLSNIYHASSFPVEIYQNILGHVSDPDWLWCTARVVCPDFKAIVERIFVLKHLPYLYLGTNGMGVSVLHLLLSF